MKDYKINILIVLVAVLVGVSIIDAFKPKPKRKYNKTKTTKIVPAKEDFQQHNIIDYKVVDRT